MLNGYYPLPNVSGSGSSYNYETLQPMPSNTNGFDARLDHYITSNQQIYARFSWKNLLSDSGQLGLPANPLLPNDINVEHDRSFIVSYNYTITPKMVNEFRFGFTNSLIDTTFPIQGAAADNQLGLDRYQLRESPEYGSVSDLQLLRRHRLYADRPRQGRAGPVKDHAVHRQPQPYRWASTLSVSV